MQPKTWLPHPQLTGYSTELWLLLNILVFECLGERKKLQLKGKHQSWGKSLHPERKGVAAMSACLSSSPQSQASMTGLDSNVLIDHPGSCKLLASCSRKVCMADCQKARRCRMSSHYHANSWNWLKWTAIYYSSLPVKISFEVQYVRLVLSSGGLLIALSLLLSSKQSGLWFRPGSLMKVPASSNLLSNKSSVLGCH